MLVGSANTETNLLLRNNKFSPIQEGEIDLCNCFLVQPVESHGPFYSYQETIWLWGDKLVVVLKTDIQQRRILNFKYSISESLCEIPETFEYSLKNYLDYWLKPRRKEAIKPVPSYHSTYWTFNAEEWFENLVAKERATMIAIDPCFKYYYKPHFNKEYYLTNKAQEVLYRLKNEQVPVKYSSKELLVFKTLEADEEFNALSVEEKIGFCVDMGVRLFQAHKRYLIKRQS